MERPTQLDPRAVAPDTELIGAYTPVPGFGVLPVNAFLIRAAEPVLVDCGMGTLRSDFLAALAKCIDPSALRYIWLTHADPDHTGALDALLAAAPNARLVTNYLGFGKLGLCRPIPPERVYLINPGQSLDVGDRQLLAIRPPSFDAPETQGVFDRCTGALFSSDCFGSVLEAPAEDLRAVTPDALVRGMTLWAGIDSPWLHTTREDSFRASSQAIEALNPSYVLGSHTPPAWRAASRLLANLDQARQARPIQLPDQAALLAMSNAP